MVDTSEYELPTNLQNFTQEDSTKVKIFLKVFREATFFETPCECCLPAMVAANVLPNIFNHPIIITTVVIGFVSTYKDDQQTLQLFKGSDVILPVKYDFGFFYRQVVNCFSCINNVFLH